MSIPEPLIAVGTAAAAVSVYIVGQVAVPDGIPKIDFSSMTATAILGWYAWHTASKTIPGIVEKHQQTVDKLCVEFKQDARDERESHAAELRELRDAFKCKACE